MNSENDFQPSVYASINTSYKTNDYKSRNYFVHNVNKYYNSNFLQDLQFIDHSQDLIYGLCSTRDYFSKFKSLKGRQPYQNARV